jgi:hypothetical protein
VKNADLRDFKDLLLGERFSEQETPDDWMIKVGRQEVVPVKGVVGFSKGRQVWVKRGPAQEFLADIKKTLDDAVDAMNGAKVVLDRVIGKGVVDQSGVLQETGVGAAEVVVDKNPSGFKKGWNKTGPKAK